MQFSATTIIIIITSIVSIVALNQHQIFDLLKFNPYRMKHNKEAWRILTGGFLHADYIHLFMNMFVLYNFGQFIENYIIKMMHDKQSGLITYLLFYLSAVVISGIYTYEKNKENLFYNAVGVSGAVSAIVFAFIVIFPFQSLYLLFIPFPIPAIVFGILYLLYSAYMAKQAKDNIGHDAHFFGAVYGLLFILILQPSLLKALISQIQIRF